VVVSADPNITLVDFAHDVPPGDIRWGAVVLQRLAAQLPRAVHVAVVDPGVGTARRALAVALTSGGAIVGPDNGVIGPASRTLGIETAVELADAGRSATFAGRDVFIPAALRIVAGEGVNALGPEVDPSGLQMPLIPAAEVATGILRAVVLGADRFGNVQLGADARSAADAGVHVGAVAVVSRAGDDRPAAVVRTFADVSEGELAVYVDSHGHVALAVNRGRADLALGTRGGDLVTIRVATTVTR